MSVYTKQRHCLLLFGSVCFLPLSRLLALLRPAVLQSKLPCCNLPLRSSPLPGVPICLLNCEQRTCLRSEPEAAAKGRRPEADGRRAEGEERRPKVVKFARLELRKNARHVSASSKGLSLLRYPWGGSVLNAVACSCTMSVKPCWRHR